MGAVYCPIVSGPLRDSTRVLRVFHENYRRAPNTNVLNYFVRATHQRTGAQWLAPMSGQASAGAGSPAPAPLASAQVEGGKLRPLGPHSQAACGEQWRRKPSYVSTASANGHNLPIRLGHWLAASGVRHCGGHHKAATEQCHSEERNVVGWPSLLARQTLNQAL